MRFGRPETLIRALTEKIRLLAPPNTNDLDSIVDFGMAVESLVEHFMSTLVELAYEVMDDQPTSKETKGTQKPKDRSFVYTHSENSSNEPALVRSIKKVCTACIK